MCFPVRKEEQLLPYLLFLQGGPGFECPRPTEASGWINKACEEFRVILMDQACILGNPSHTKHVCNLFTSANVFSCSEEQVYQLL